MCSFDRKTRGEKEEKTLKIKLYINFKKAEGERECVRCGVCVCVCVCVCVRRGREHCDFCW